MSKKKQADQLTETQLEIMALIWERGEATVADVWEELHKRRRLARNTVQTMLVRLEEKGFLKHRSERNAFVYWATRQRQTTVSTMLRGLVRSVFDGSTSGLIMSLIEHEQLSDAEFKRIRALLQSKTNLDKGKK